MRVLGCAVRAPLGCLAFLVGGLVVLVLFLPVTLGNLATGAVEEVFEARFAGQLDLGKAWLGSLYSEQSIEEIVLREPDGRELARGRLSAPSLWPAFRGGTTWGPVVLRVDRVALRRDEDGLSNLARTFAPNPTPQPGRRGETELDFDELDMDLIVDRLDWSDAEGRTLAVEDLRCSVRWSDRGETLDCEGHGRGVLVAQGPGGVEEGSFGCAWSIEGLLGERPLRWRFSVRADRAPLALLLALVGPAHRLAPELGEVVTDLDLTLSGDEHGRRLELEVDGAALGLRAGGRVDGERGLLIGEGADELVVRLPSGSARAQAFLAAFFPLADEAHSDRADGLELTLRAFELPFDADLGRLDAVVDLSAGTSTLRFAQPVSRRLLIEESLAVPSPQTFQLTGGEVRYDGFELPSRHGPIRFDGSFDVEDGVYSLIVTLPDRAVFDVAGPRARPVIQPLERE